MEEARDSRHATASLHGLGVLSGLAAGVWLGAAEAPTKLVSVGLSPFLISLGMVAGVFVSRWTLPSVLKGTHYVARDLLETPHLVLWGILAGALWAVANTLTVFAIRDVGLSIAFPLWNTNSLVGLFWGWFFFEELRGAGASAWLSVLGGGVAIVAGAILLGYASARPESPTAPRALAGILAALGAGLLWGTMYIPYRKAYLSGMNPLSFVTVFAVGELLTMSGLALAFLGGPGPLLDELSRARPVLFWLFLGGFCWVIGDLFQQYAAKYIGIGRGIPLSNTNQLWGLAWGGLVFGELAAHGPGTRALVLAGSALMILGAIAISSAVAPASERASWRRAIQRECERYGLDIARLEQAQSGLDPLGREVAGRGWIDALIALGALSLLAWLASQVERPPIAMDLGWTAALGVALGVSLLGCGVLLWKKTRFS